MAGMPRVLLGHIFHEGHCFNPVPTLEKDFFQFRGAAMLEAARGSSGILGGLFAGLAAAGVAPVPTVSAKARPGGAVERGFYDRIKAELVDTARREAPDAILLSLHGAMLVDGIPDTEGDLLMALRAAAPQAVIGIGLDLHAYVTDTMLAAADIVVACKENPHSDLFQAGERVAALALDALAGRLRPVTAAVRLPFMSRGNSETAAGPLRDLHARARALVAAGTGLRDVSIFNCHSFVNAPHIGQWVVAIADGDAAAATAAAGELGAEMWRRRGEFVLHWPDLDGVIDRVVADRAGRPFVMGDKGDNVLAGAPGDNPAMLRRLLARDPPIVVALPLTDPDAVAACAAAGVGARVTLPIGGRWTTWEAPVEVTGVVEHLGDGRYVQTGAYGRGQPASLGATALLRVGRHAVLLTAESGLTQDPNAFESQGVRIADHDLVVAKSFFHFKISFEGIATPIQADTPGMSAFRPSELPYTVARPFWPADEVELDHLPIAVFDHADRRSRRVTLR